MKYSREVLKTTDDKNVLWRGSKVIQIKPNIRKSITRKKLLKEMDVMEKKLKEKDFQGAIMISVQDPETGKWYSGDFTSIKKKEPISVPYAYIDSSGKFIQGEANVSGDAEKYSDFRIYLLEKDVRNKRNNDDQFEEVEEEQNPNEPKQKPLKGGSIQEDEYKQSLENDKDYFTKGISKQDAKLIIYEVNKDWTINYFKDDTLYINKSFDELKPIKSKPRSSGYLVLKREYEKGDTRPLQEYYNDYIAMAQEIKGSTNGEINMFQTGDIKKTALNLFYRFIKDKNVVCEPITAEEAKWINNASTGALIMATPFEGQCYGYDVHSYYPSIVYEKSFFIPIKQGTFTTLTYDKPLTSNCQFGIYRCTITGNINKFLFRQNPKNYYTSIDINRAIKLGYEVKYIIDNEPNALVYKKDHYIKGYDIFSDYIDFVFELKKSSVSGAKLLLNILLGALVKSKSFEVDISKDGIQDNSIIQAMHPNHNDTGVEVKMTKEYKQFECNFARLKPFLYAKGREKTGRLYEHQIDDVVRVNCDGFIMKSPLTKTKLGNHLGELGEDKKYTCRLNVQKVNKIEFL